MPAIATIRPSDVPKIDLWLEYCDRHPNRSGDNLVDIAWKFEKESFRWIDQLVGTTVSVEKLSEWLGVGKGMAILLMKYAVLGVFPRLCLCRLRRGKWQDPKVAVLSTTSG